VGVEGGELHGKEERVEVKRMGKNGLGENGEVRREGRVTCVVENEVDREESPGWIVVGG
jgi:hypothetical protein